MLDYYRQFQPSMYRGLMKIADVWGTKKQIAVLKKEYKDFIQTSIDLGILEKLPSNVVATIEADMGWEDIGISWETFYRALATKKQKNVIEGGVDTEFIDSDENLVFGSKGKMIGLIGVSNLIVIDTSDGLLICKLDQSHKVKDLYKKLERYHKEYIE